MRGRQDQRLRFDVALRLPRDPRSVGLVRRVAAAGLGELGVTQACTDDINLALSEACTNAVRHAESSEGYEVRLSVDTAACRITVADDGCGFDPDTAHDSWPALSQPHGRGLALMRALVDELELTTGQGGTVVRLVKALEIDNLDRIPRTS